MSTSATERATFTYLVVTAFVAIFGGVYEAFSHGIWSGCMVYAFAFPLGLGALPFSWKALKKRPLPSRWCLRFHHASVATLTVGSIMEGVHRIYGATNRLTLLYWIVGIALLILAQTIRLLRK